MSHTSLRIAIIGLLIILLVGVILALSLISNASTASTSLQRHAFSTLIASLRNTTLHSGSVEEEISLVKAFMKKHSQFQAILLYSYASGVEYMSARAPNYVVQNEIGDPQLRKAGVFTTNLTQSYYKKDGSSFSLETITRTISQNALFNIIALCTAGIAVATLMLLLILLGYDMNLARKQRRYVERPKKKRPERKIARRFVHDVDERATAEREETIREDLQPEPSLHSEAERKETIREDLQSEPLLHGEKIVETFREDTGASPSMASTKIPQTAESERSDLDLHEEDAPEKDIFQALFTPEEEAHADYSEAQDIADDSEAPEDSEIEAILDSDENIDSPEIAEPAHGEKLLLLQRVSEEMERSYYFSQDLSLAIVRMPAPADTAKSCWNLIEKLSIIRNTTFRLNGEQVAIIYPNTDINKAVEAATALYENCRTTLNVELTVGVVSLQQRIITPEFFLAEAEQTLRKADAALPPVMGFAPHPKEFQKIREEVLSFNELEGLPLPPPDFDLEEEELAAITEEKKRAPAEEKSLESVFSGERLENDMDVEGDLHVVEPGDSKASYANQEFWDSLIIH